MDTYIVSLLSAISTKHFMLKINKILTTKKGLYALLRKQKKRFVYVFIAMHLRYSFQTL